MVRLPPSPSDPQYWVPNTDVYISEEGHLVIEVEVAAVTADDLELTIEANRVIIRGERPDGGRRRRCKYLVEELRYGQFESVAEIPTAYDCAHAVSDYRNGILRIDLPPKR